MDTLPPFIRRRVAMSGHCVVGGDDTGTGDGMGDMGGIGCDAPPQSQSPPSHSNFAQLRKAPQAPSSQKPSPSIDSTSSMGVPLQSVTFLQGQSPSSQLKTAQLKSIP